jgi:hypothetical protein
MTEQEIARFALVLKEAARIRAEIAEDEAEDARRRNGAAHLRIAPSEESPSLASFAA